MTIRKLVLQMQFSLDGFVAGASGELDWIFPDFDADSAKWTVEKLWQAGAHLMGRVRSEERTSELQSQQAISYAVFCLDRKSVV